jgi:hypothetical protein
MTFEEEFPSLKKFTIYGAGTLYHQNTILEYCLDKQKVKDAIDKVSNYARKRKDISGCIIFVRDLLKELNLE